MGCNSSKNVSLEREKMPRLTTEDLFLNLKEPVIIRLSKFVVADEGHTETLDLSAISFHVSTLDELIDETRTISSDGHELTKEELEILGIEAGEVHHECSGDTKD